MSETNLVGGTAEDRKEILRLHEKYIDVNTRFDWQTLQPIFSPSPEARYFNLNGHTYEGREHWIRLWKFYGQNVQSTYWTPFDIGGTVSDDLAVVGAIARRDGSGLEKSRRRVTSVTTTQSSFRVRRWSSAKKTVNGAWFMPISRLPIPARDRAASKRLPPLTRGKTVIQFRSNRMSAGALCWGMILRKPGYRFFLIPF